MRVRFSREVRFTPPEERRVSIHYLPDMELTIRRRWGELLQAAGYCVEIEPPNRPERDRP